MKAASVVKGKYAQAPQDDDFLATARVVLDIHRDDRGFCLGCYVYFRHLKLFPCEYRTWAARVLATYPMSAPSGGTAPVRDRQSKGTRSTSALRLVPPPTSSASDDTVVLPLT
ncbi:hypothetical protein [Micromonospora tulbaghiae]|uniref:hypothetical protein n=1 Tax=Micromonospora tulbaghiae TaxID=479978 RepID=UPI0036C333A4